ncbi:MAG: sensor histidine kinase [Sphingomonadaceae bacterium]
MNAAVEDRARPRSASLSTATKMLLFLSAGLLPLGLIAILASIDSAGDNRREREAQAEALVQAAAHRVDSIIARSTITIRTASTAVSLTRPGSAVCRRTLQQLSDSAVFGGQYALYGADGELRCATPGFAPEPVPARGNARSAVAIDEDGGRLAFTLYDDAGQIVGAGAYSRQSLAETVARRIVRVMPRTGVDLALRQGDRVMPLLENFEPRPLVQRVNLAAPVAAGRLRMEVLTGAAPMSATQLLMILLPVMMWVAAAMIGWMIVDRLLLRPLVGMQKIVASYQPGDADFAIPDMRTPAREIAALGRAFNNVTRTVASREAELETALARQKRLVREVHHRVKNNLQVIASLLNLHSRGSGNPFAAAAYASIQRRVDALAVVHRNHFAELDENRGVPLKPLISELAANMRATAPEEAARMAMRLDIEPCHADQDAAVSVAFLITEIVEFAMLSGVGSITVSLHREDDDRARLAIEGEGLRNIAAAEEPRVERFERVVAGLARQLRSALEVDEQAGRYMIRIATICNGGG